MSNDWLEGYLTALMDYAWWKDGVQYVGCGVKTLKEVKERAIAAYGPKPTAPLPDKLKCDYCGTMVRRSEIGGHENWCREEAK